MIKFFHELLTCNNVQAVDLSTSSISPTIFNQSQVKLVFYQTARAVKLHFKDPNTDAIDVYLQNF